MTGLILNLELITRGFCGGASPEQQAEIRAPTIRGQLRWWFRVLGGFKTLGSMPLHDQEKLVFGAMAGDEGTASKLQVRVRATNGSSLVSTTVKNTDELNAGMNTPEGYLLFPLRPPRGRALFLTNLPKFELHLNWRGDARHAEDIKALGTVFGHLGSLGFRSRRCMGALAFQDTAPMPFADAFTRFAGVGGIAVKQLTSAANAEDATRQLANWLKGWRAHGRAPNLSTGPGFRYAKNDHDMGLGNNQGPAFRAALGLPIIQRFTTANRTSNWEESAKRGEGRFASPVLLRPYRAQDGKAWRALVIFVEAHKWPAGKPVFLDGQPQKVSLDLYTAMKSDPALQPFTP